MRTQRHRLARLSPALLLAWVVLPVLADERIPDYRRDVQPILASRCVACHACNDAPCQLNLASAEGIARGANAAPVYNASRLRPAKPTRLFTDATGEPAWRALGFHSVLPAAPGTAEGQASLLARTLALKRQNPQPAASPLPAAFRFGLDTQRVCPQPAAFERFAIRNPLAGMPYALPGLPAAEEAVLLRWLNAGAPLADEPPPPPADLARIRTWEEFLNGPSLRERLMSRYLYEHLFQASLYFDEPAAGGLRNFYRLVRSRTPPGQPVAVIATRRPYEDPGVPTFWYRLEPERGTVVAKTHLPYAFGPARIIRYRELFLDPPASVTAFPSWSPAVASNPFVAFRELPQQGRYRFLLDDAAFFIAGFIKGPVCRGQVAVDVIDDRFWVAFLQPDHPLVERSPELLERASRELRVPSSESFGPVGVITWRKYARQQRAYLKAKRSFLIETARDGVEPTLDLVWDGDGQNPNGALTVFRHFDSATVVPGFVGTPPKTAWLIGYSLFERIHYLLVAGFDVYGNLAHQLNSRLYMDFLRMEGEFNFLAMLPMASREAVRDYWYREAPQSVREHVYGMLVSSAAETAIDFQTDDPRRELMRLIAERLDAARTRRFELLPGPDAEVFAPLTGVRGVAATLMPETAVLIVADGAGEQLYTIVRDSAHYHVASLFSEARYRLPAEDELTVVPGVIGSYPNAVFRLQRTELPGFVASVAALNNGRDYGALVARYGVTRTNPGFWIVADTLQQRYAETEPLTSGVLDLSRLESR
jgi:hypothetical protein